MERIKLKMMRQASGLSVDTIAGLLNKSSSAYRRVENGNAKLVDTDMLKLCNIYNCKLEQLVDEPVARNYVSIDMGQWDDANNPEVQQIRKLMEEAQKKHEAHIVGMIKSFLQSFTDILEKNMQP